MSWLLVQCNGARLTAAILLLLPAISTFVHGQPAAESTAEHLHQERAISILQGRPAIAVASSAVLGGASAALTNRLTNASLRDAAELVLRRNGIPVISSCEGGAVNCGKTNVEIQANCAKTELLASNDRLCALQVKVQYLENVYSARPGADPSNDLSYRGFSVVWEEPFLPTFITERLLEEKARKSWTDALEKFSLYYLRFEPEVVAPRKRFETRFTAIPDALTIIRR